MRLLIDLGNSRLKWALADDDDALRIGDPLAHTDTGLADLAQLLAAAGGVQSVWLTSTAHSLTGALVDALVRAGLPTPVVFSSPKQALGLRSAYDQPETLGRDRFLGMVGARSIYDGPLMLADAGTALTVDVVDGDGQHLGGLIVPGPVLMREALHRGTAGVRAGAVVRLHELARNTDDAVWSGGCLACIALIEHTHRQATLGIGEHVELILTGGAMPALVGHIDVPYRLLDDIVLRGLNVWSRSALSQARS